MSVLVSVNQIRKAFGAQPLFEGVTFSIESGERIGLIGPNGAGKSTLLRILSQQTTADQGNVAFQRGLRVGFLEQTPLFPPNVTVLDAVLGTHATLDQSDFTKEDWERLGLAEELLSRLSLDGRNGIQGDSQVNKLSGGWKKRVALARELVKKPDLLLLDEPTNHLDIDGIFWLEEFLERSPFATLTITHDRAFLQNIANRILELDKRNVGGLMSVKGDYATYLDIKEQTMAAQERREIILKNTLRRETEWLRRGAKARTTKQQARIKRHGELSDEVGGLTTRNQVRTARIDFEGAEKNPKKLIDAKGISKSYGDRKIFSKFDLMITPGLRLGLLGLNGCGKSTLIRCLLGEETTDTGTVTRSDLIQISYFEQNREELDPKLTLVKTLCPSGDYVDYRGGRVHIRSYLDRFLFTTGQMEMAVGKLSGGEQSRLLIAKLMLSPANVLVLDEPTNDLDMATLTVLEECLTEFPGAILLVTHDRYFMDQVANRILAFDPGQPGVLTAFADLDQWETWHRHQNTAEALAVAHKTPEPAKLTPSAPKAKKLNFKEQREFDTMESTIHTLEKKLADLETSSTQTEVMKSPSKLREVAEQMTQCQAEIEKLYARWAELDQFTPKT